MADWTAFDGVNVSTWDDTTRTRTIRTVKGVFVSTASYTAADDVAASARAAERTAATNRAILRSRAVTALDTNATYQAIGTPTNPQVVAQVAALTRQNNGIIRLLLGQLDTLNGA
jgi:hypothetical protein